MKSIYKQSLVFLYMLTALGSLQAQDLIPAKFRLVAQKAAENEIKIDGDLAESVWQQAEKTTPFWESKPNDKDLAKTQTIVQVAYDSKYLYISAKIEGSNFVSQTRKRDQFFWESESFAVILDPMNRQSNGFFFGLTSNNVQCEDLLGSALFREMNFAWDTKWYSVTQVQEGFWTLEMAIPLRILPYKEDVLEWGINFVRPDFNNNQITTWTKVPVNFWPIDLGQTGTLVWNTPPPKPAKNIAVIPYATGNATQDQENQENDLKMNAGLDARYAITPALNVDLTINPDFSQIEVDAQQTNLGRFNLYFPEKRTFFLENSDIFGDYAIPSFMTPFYSRKIGLDEDGNAIPILFGARLSGNLTPTLRIGAMDMQTSKQGGTPAQNYSALSLNQRIFKRSTVKTYFLNRTILSASNESKLDPLLAYGRNAGSELQYINNSGSLTLNPSFHYSWKEGIKSDNWFYNFQGRYRKRSYQVFTDFINVGTNYYADMGFSTRLKTYDIERDTSFQVGFKEWFNRFDYYIRPKESKINTITLIAWDSQVWNPEYFRTDHVIDFNADFGFKNRSSFLLKINYSNINLPYAFDISEDLRVDKAEYHFPKLSLQYSSSNIKPFYYTLNLGTGEYYGAKINTLKFNLNYRVQPWGNFSLISEYNQIRLKGISENILLISPKTEINFSNNLFWTTFFQYNTQANNFNINSRLQWRYRPMSDLYLVYTDNYTATPFFNAKNRALVFKINYWLNL
ncbi:MAG: DUF5916 domain-containing protein [Haliscomenobacter sp.]|uniref:DUF5916 domain-containing protein n=1 Tax=Haliscomenobacter sp. TaxID=2717303 RepID=UPI0029A5C661|nr:DUF5916 domain-containing protein [Haliscomenobacter sp.]MDX2068166.1 DUF5916 domain-containing protein [Haliscomenobacter sp.]